MKKFLRHTMLFFTVGTLLLASGVAVYAAQGGVSSSSLDTTVNVRAKEAVSGARQTDSSRESVNRSSARSVFSSWLLHPFRSASSEAQSEKLLSNVKVFPGSSGESLSVSFRLNKRADVSIKIMDALGNELMTLFSQPMDAGIQNQSLDVQPPLNAGIYFVRVSAGTETVVKRISIL